MNVTCMKQINEMNSDLYTEKRLGLHVTHLDKHISLPQSHVSALYTAQAALCVSVGSL